MSSKHSNSESLIDVASDLIYETHIINTPLRTSPPVHEDLAQTNLRMRLESPITRRQELENPTLKWCILQVSERLRVTGQT